MKFKITYIDPIIEEKKTVVMEFEDTPNAEIKFHAKDKSTFVNISAREWAEDYAYSLADKGWYNIEQLSMKGRKGRI